MTPRADCSTSVPANDTELFTRFDRGERGASVENYSFRNHAYPHLRVGPHWVTTRGVCY